MCWFTSQQRRVYPRTHGETIFIVVDLLSDQGLSPYTRGNLGDQIKTNESIRSIPVHTGKPSVQEKQPGETKVYPRTHGETR